MMMVPGWFMLVIVISWLSIRAIRQSNIKRFEQDVATRCPLNANGIVIGAESINLSASSSRAVLLLHGFGDTPQSLTPLANALHAAGWTVSAPLLPGHGRALREYARANHTDWIHSSMNSYDELSATHASVVVCGISMGAALAVLLTTARPKIPALVLLAPYLTMPRDVRIKATIAKLLQFVLPYHANTGSEISIHDPVARSAALGMGVITATLMTELRTVATLAEHALPAVHVPTLYLQSREDNRIPASAAIAEFAKLGSQIKEQRWLTGCGHIITVDYCKVQLASQVVDWFSRYGWTHGWTSESE